MAENPRKPKSQYEISTGKENPVNRALQVRRDNDNVKDYRVKLEDIDSAISYYFDKVILPNVTENGSLYTIPVIYGSPERWKSTQEDGYYKDRTGKIQVPLIMFRRNGMAKNRNLGNKIDANFPQLYQTFTKQWSKKNRYSGFSILNNYSPVREQYNVVIPDYVDITYEFIIWTDFMDQMNNIVEAINYSEGTYWGMPEKFKFRTKIDDFSNVTELNDGADRLVRTTFNLTLYGYIISDTLNKQIAQQNRKAYTNFTIKFGQEIQGSTDIGYSTGTDENPDLPR